MKIKKYFLFKIIPHKCIAQVQNRSSLTKVHCFKLSSNNETVSISKLFSNVLPTTALIVELNKQFIHVALKTILDNKTQLKGTLRYLLNIFT